MNNIETNILRTFQEYEKNSSRIIPDSNFFIVNIEFNKSLLESAALTIGQSFFSLNELSLSPLIVYISPRRICILFSSIDSASNDLINEQLLENENNSKNNISESKHIFLGNHNYIVSLFTSKMALFIKETVLTTITELTTRGKCICFFHYFIAKNHYDYLKINNIDEIDVLTCETDKTINPKQFNFEKCGILIREVDEGKFEYLSELFDLSNSYEKYNKFFFDD